MSADRRVLERDRGRQRQKEGEVVQAELPCMRSGWDRAVL